MMAGSLGKIESVMDILSLQVRAPGQRQQQAGQKKREAGIFHRFLFNFSLEEQGSTTP
jgi:hypothetical protein